jgi:inner membrane protein YidH
LPDPDPSEVPYNRFSPDDLILRDLLAIDRTILANERTLLSYCRTVLAMFAAGASLIHFIDAAWALVTGVVFIAGGVVVLAFGIWRFRRVQHDLNRARR